jgi:hypothetical protein
MRRARKVAKQSAVIIPVLREKIRTAVQIRRTATVARRLTTSKEIGTSEWHMSATCAFDSILTDARERELSRSTSRRDVLSSPNQLQHEATNMQPTKAELLNRRFLEGARERATLKRGDRHPTMVLRTSRFVEILKTSPTLIHYEPDYHNSVPGWPRYVPTFEDVAIVLSELAL